MQDFDHQQYETLAPMIPKSPVLLIDYASAVYLRP